MPPKKPSSGTKKKTTSRRKKADPKPAEEKQAEIEPAPKEWTFHERLGATFAALGNVPKTGWNDFHKYFYVTEVDLIRAIRPVLAANGLFITANDRSVQVLELGHVLLEVEYTITGPDGNSLSFIGYGEGRDISSGKPGDKALYKAKTGALKYALAKTFMIDTGDDPEMTTETAAPEPASSRQGSQRPTQAPRGGRQQPRQASKPAESNSAPQSQPEPSDPDSPPWDTAKSKVVEKPSESLPPNIMKRTAAWCRKIAGELEEHGYNSDESWQEAHNVLAILIGYKIMDSLHDLTRAQADRIDAILRTKSPEQIRNLVNAYVAEANAPREEDAPPAESPPEPT